MYKFSMDFNMGRGAIENLTNLINTYGVPNRIVEVGVFEGSTTFWMADNITPHNPNLMIDAIDPHVGSNDMSEDFNVVQQNFVHNLNACQHKNVNYIKEFSKRGLIHLIQDGVKAQLIYIDGDHKAGEVLTDLVLSWEILEVGGVILCDDTTTFAYGKTEDALNVNNSKFANNAANAEFATTANNSNYAYGKIESAQMSPRLAVETFIQCNWHKIRILSLPDGSQTAFMKVSE